jgi:hypothetical protein
MGQNKSKTKKEAWLGLGSQQAIKARLASLSAQ